MGYFLSNTFTEPEWDLISFLNFTKILEKDRQDDLEEEIQLNYRHKIINIVILY